MGELNLGNEYLLERTNEDYFSAIRPSELYLSKLHALKEHLLKARVVASLGMAGGEDLCTLAKMYGEGTRLIGVDISPIALELARRATLAAGLKVDFIQGNATSLNISDRSVDGFVLSAILHEVYSYAEDGKYAFAKTIEETYRKTSIDGCIFISDFAAPGIEGKASLQPKSKEAEKFINYFTNNFRKFNDIQKHIKKPLASNDPLYVKSGTETDSHLYLTSAFISEALWHFKYYKKNSDCGRTFDNDFPLWKEINEVYLPPNPLTLEGQPMPIDEYIDTVRRICHDTELTKEVTLKCVSAVLIPQRPNTVDMLDEHFTVALDDNDKISKSLITECTNWMDLIFKKVSI